jgi:hypothetical protein
LGSANNLELFEFSREPGQQLHMEGSGKIQRQPSHAIGYPVCMLKVDREGT